MIDMDLEAMQNIDFMTIDPETLVDLRDVNINVSLTRNERIIQYLEQMKNPFYCKFEDVILKLNYPITDRTINEALENHAADI